jgi:hypothetical protein
VKKSVNSGGNKKMGEEFQGKEGMRGPETLPPWNLVFKWSDTSWYHSLGPGSFSTLHFDHGTSNALTQSLN